MNPFVKFTHYRGLGISSRFMMGHCGLEPQTPVLSEMSILYYLLHEDSHLFMVLNLIKQNLVTIEQTSGRTEHHRKLHVLIGAEIRAHKLAGRTFLLA